MASGKTFKICGCRDGETGRLLGRKCPKLRRASGQWSPHHGTWSYQLELPPNVDGSRRNPVGRLIAAGHWREGDPDILIVMNAGYDVTRLVFVLADLPVIEGNPHPAASRPLARRPRPQAGVAVVLGHRCHRHLHRSLLAVLPAKIRPGTHLPAVQTDPGLDRPGAGGRAGGCLVRDVVPEGRLVVLGDGPVSEDSRVWGYVRFGRVLGAVVCRLASAASGSAS
ncbi:S26 family signal peptidase [Actinoallomurus sp. CA-150999]|uniref:S26 family signal peptidase n=1 Tax=Actinoallomurus sp. CA-150999 TaxID=3239887 RepID=UPI003D9396A2